MYRIDQAVFVRIPGFLFVSFYSFLFYVSPLPSFVASSIRPRRPRARCRPHRNDSVKFIRLRYPFLSLFPSTRLTRSTPVLNPSCQASRLALANQAIRDPFSRSRAFASSV